jgi:hypothetical protein
LKAQESGKPAPPQQPAYAPPQQPAYAPPPAPPAQQAPYPPQPPQPQQAPYPPHPPQQVPYPPQQPYPQQHPGYGYPQQAPPKKKKTGLIIGIAAGVAVIVIAVVLILVLGGGGGGGISGKWVVTDTEGWSDYEEGLIFNFKGGTLTFEAPKGTPDELKGMYELMNMIKTKYKTSGDTLTLTVEFFGQKEETVMHYVLEGDTLKLFDEDNDVTVLKRTK